MPLLQSRVQAILRRGQQGAIALLEVVLRQGSVTGVQLVMTLGTHLVGARLARALVHAGTPAGRLRAVLFGRLKAARPAGVGRWSEVAAAWSDAAGLWRSDELDEAIATAGTADRRLKSTTISDEGGSPPEADKPGGGGICCAERRGDDARAIPS